MSPSSTHPRFLHHCLSCLTCTTRGRWRHGPDGLHTLCVRCYSRYCRNTLPLFAVLPDRVSVAPFPGAVPAQVVSWPRDERGRREFTKPPLVEAVPVGELWQGRGLGKRFAEREANLKGSVASKKGKVGATAAAAEVAGSSHRSLQDTREGTCGAGAKEVGKASGSTGRVVDKKTKGQGGRVNAKPANSTGVPAVNEKTDMPCMTCSAALAPRLGVTTPAAEAASAPRQRGSASSSEHEDGVDGVSKAVVAGSASSVAVPDPSEAQSGANGGEQSGNGPEQGSSSGDQLKLTYATRCVHCAASVSSYMWRHGPDGRKTLCRKCYCRYARKMLPLYARFEGGKPVRVSVAPFEGAVPVQVSGWPLDRLGKRDLRHPVVEPVDEIEVAGDQIGGSLSKGRAVEKRSAASRKRRRDVAPEDDARSQPKRAVLGSRGENVGAGVNHDLRALRDVVDPLGNGVSREIAKGQGQNVTPATVRVRHTQSVPRVSCSTAARKIRQSTANPSLEGDVITDDAVDEARPSEVMGVRRSASKLAKSGKASIAKARKQTSLPSRPSRSRSMTANDILELLTYKPPEDPQQDSENMEEVILVDAESNDYSSTSRRDERDSDALEDDLIHQSLEIRNAVPQERRTIGDQICSVTQDARAIGADGILPDPAPAHNKTPRSHFKGRPSKLYVVDVEPSYMPEGKQSVMGEGSGPLHSVDRRIPAKGMEETPRRSSVRSAELRRQSLPESTAPKRGVTGADTVNHIPLRHQKLDGSEPCRVDIDAEPAVKYRKVAEDTEENMEWNAQHNAGADSLSPALKTRSGLQEGQNVHDNTGEGGIGNMSIGLRKGSASSPRSSKERKIRIRHLLAYHITAFLLNEHDEYSPDQGSVRVWMKRTLFEMLAKMGEEVKGFSSFDDASVALFRRLGQMGLDLRWFERTCKEKYLEGARQNYATWEPPPSDEEWNAEASLLRFISATFNRVLRKYTIQENETEVQVCDAIINLVCSETLLASERTASPLNMRETL